MNSVTDERERERERERESETEREKRGRENYHSAVSLLVVGYYVITFS